MVGGKTRCIIATVKIGNWELHFAKFQPASSYTKVIFRFPEPSFAGIEGTSAVFGRSLMKHL